MRRLDGREVGVDPHHEVGESLVVVLMGVVGGPAVVADHPQHRLPVLGEPGKGPTAAASSAEVAYE